MFTVNKHPSSRDVRWFAGGIGLGLPLLVLLYYLLRARHATSTPIVFYVLLCLACAGVLVAVVALMSPTWGGRLYVGWMTMTLPIGLAMSTLLLSVIYYLVLPIFSLIVRRRDPLRKKLGGQTYWEDYRCHEPRLDRMRRPF